jgi:hypothetical protein
MLEENSIDPQLPQEGNPFSDSYPIDYDSHGFGVHQHIPTFDGDFLGFQLANTLDNSSLILDSLPMSVLLGHDPRPQGEKQPHYPY